MPTWGISASSDPPRLVVGRFSLPCAQLCGPVGDRAERRVDRQQHLLPAVPGTAAGSVDLLGDRGHHHRQPIDHHRRLLHDPAGDPARLAAAPAYHADFGAGLWPNLCRRRQLAVDGGDHRADAAVPQVRQSRRRLRHRRLADHADDVFPAVHRHARDLAMEPVGQRRHRRPVHHCRCRFFRLEFAENPRRRLRAAAACRGRLWADADLASRHGRRCAQPGANAGRGAGISRRYQETRRGARARNGGLSHPHDQRRAAGDALAFAAKPRPARARRRRAGGLPNPSRGCIGPI